MIDAAKLKEAVEFFDDGQDDAILDSRRANLQRELVAAARLVLAAQAAPSEVGAIANAINHARYAHPETPYRLAKDVRDEDKSSRDYAFRLARAALAAASLHRSVEARGVTEERRAIAEKAREWSAHYSHGSDGRNTFALLAEWIEAREGTAQPDRDVPKPYDYDTQDRGPSPTEQGIASTRKNCPPALPSSAQVRRGDVEDILRSADDRDVAVDAIMALFGKAQP